MSKTILNRYTHPDHYDFWCNVYIDTRGRTTYGVPWTRKADAQFYATQRVRQPSYMLHVVMKGE